MTYHRMKTKWAAGRSVPGGSAVQAVCSCGKFTSAPGSTGGVKLEWQEHVKEVSGGAARSTVE